MNMKYIFCNSHASHNELEDVVAPSQVEILNDIFVLEEVLPLLAPVTKKVTSIRKGEYT